jgi:hypothetical protein
VAQRFGRYRMQSELRAAIANRSRLTHSDRMQSSIDALRNAHRRRRADLRLPGAIADFYCSDAVPVNPEPGEPKMRLLPYVSGLPPETDAVAPTVLSKIDVLLTSTAAFPPPD